MYQIHVVVVIAIIIIFFPSISGHSMRKKFRKKKRKNDLWIKKGKKKMTGINGRERKSPIVVYSYRFLFARSFFIWLVAVAIFIRLQYSKFFFLLLLLNRRNCANVHIRLCNQFYLIWYLVFLSLYFRSIRIYYI